MASFINIAMVGEAPRILNLDLVLELSMWNPPEGAPGTTFKMAVQHNRGATEGPYVVTVRTPFADIIGRMRNEVLRVGQPPVQLAPVATQE